MTESRVCDLNEGHLTVAFLGPFLSCFHQSESGKSVGQVFQGELRTFAVDMRGFGGSFPFSFKNNSEQLPSALQQLFKAALSIHFLLSSSASLLLARDRLDHDQDSHVRNASPTREGKIINLASQR